jgi:hypothetical protein
MAEIAKLEILKGNLKKRPWLCPKCYVLLAPPELNRRDALRVLEYHEQQGHCEAEGETAIQPVVVTPGYVTCPECGQKGIRSKRLPKHLARKCPKAKTLAAIRHSLTSVALNSKPLRTPEAAAHPSPQASSGPPNDIPVANLHFDLLKPETWGRDMVDHFKREQRHILRRVPIGRAIDWTRLKKIRSLNPDKCYVGKDKWLGYVVFEFNRYPWVILECPITGNATYILSHRWQTLIHYGKKRLITEFKADCQRVVHSDKWFEKIRNALNRRCKTAMNKVFAAAR